MMRVVVALVFTVGISRAGEGEIEAGKFDFLGGKTSAQVIEKVGAPAARYQGGLYEYWLYPNAVRERDGVRRCVEAVFKSGKMTQMNFLTEETMKKSVEIVKGFGDWAPSAEVKVKEFYALGTSMVGKTKTEVVEAFGQPDVRRVFNGKEVWDYQKVPMEKGSEKQLTVFVEFEDDKVSGTTGN